MSHMEAFIESRAGREASNEALSVITDPPLFGRLNFFVDFGSNFGNND